MEGDRIREEQNVVETMIRMYCRSLHQEEVPCRECEALLDYTRKRVAGCRFGPDKPFCSNCQVHCFRPEMRQRIRAVMRFSGPRMILVHPTMAIRHFVASARAVWSR